jgi:type IV secretory pathway TraG/TraD family ATPase VirD4
MDEQLKYKGYTQHEWLTIDVRMFAKMVVFSVVFGFVVFVLYALVVWNVVNRPFVNLGLGEGVFKNYLFNKYVFCGLAPDSRVELEPVLRNIVGADRVSRVEYNRLVEALFKGQGDRRIRGLLEEGEGEFLRLLYYGVFVGLGFSVLYIVFFFVGSRKHKKSEFLRWSRLLGKEQFLRKVREYVEDDLNIEIGDLVIPRRLETLHTLVFGATGTGKSVLTNQYVEQIIERRERHRLDEKLILYDVKGELISIFYQGERDFIFCPFDQRSVRWSFFNEIASYPDFDIIAKKLFIIPPGNERNEYWYNAAKAVFRMGLIYLDMTNKNKNEDIVNFFSLPLTDIREELSGVLPLKEQGPLKHISGTDNRQADSVLSILQDRIDFFKYLIGMDGGFSFRTFIREKFQESNLFLLNLSMFGEIFKPLLTFAIDVMTREVLLKKDLTGLYGERTHFIIDEINSLGKIDSIVDYVTQARVKGGCLFATAQDKGKLEDIYGRNLLTTINNNCNTKMTFRINDFGSAKYNADDLGEIQEIRKRDARSVSPSPYGDRATINDQEKKDPVVLPAEIQNLDDLEFFIKMSNIGITKMKIPRKHFTQANKHFILNEFQELSLIQDGELKEKFKNRLIEI